MNTYKHKHPFSDKETLTVKMDHLVHSEKFWEVVLLLFLVAAFIGLAIWAGLQGNVPQNEMPVTPYWPYIP